ncbi:MAG: enolase C-terminal domain-like protein, partial [Candidatus Bathyarchaeia archaeon]
LRKQLRSSYGRTAINVGDEGGFSPPMSRPEEALDAIRRAAEEMGYGGVSALAMDVAASSFHRPGEGYSVAGRRLSRGELIDYYRELAEAYPLVSIEDPLHEEDFEGFAEVTREIPIQILGDDIFVTNVLRLRRGIEMGAANALLWKVNQVGTVTEALEAAALADLAVGIGFGQIKAGAPCRGERTAKYNRLLRIEERLGERARYPKGLLG